mgnify:CR=1 FL=1
MFIPTIPLAPTTCSLTIIPLHPIPVPISRIMVWLLLRIPTALAVVVVVAVVDVVVAVVAAVVLDVVPPIIRPHVMMIIILTRPQPRIVIIT